MDEYIELTEELKLSMCAGARAILSTKKYHGTIYVQDVFSDSPKEMPYLKAAEILYAASEKEPEEVAPVVHGKWILVDTEKWIGVCSNCNRQDRIDHLARYCRFCGARMSNA